MRSKALALLLLFLAIPAAAAVPKLVMPSDEGGDGIVLSAAEIRVTIRGHLARTEYDLTFRNNLNHVAGGDFFFPIPPDGEVSDLGLYFDGVLRHAVAVERVLARNAYQESVHKSVDPALAEWGDSRTFRMRVFPVPANGGTKRVYLAADQELASNDYLLDLRFQQKLDAFTLTVDSDVQPVVAEGLVLSAGRVHLEHAVLDATVSVHHPEGDTALVAWSERDRAWVVSAAAKLSAEARPFDPAPHVTLLWDASGSSVQQNGPKLRAFLDRFFRRQLAWTNVTVVPFHLWVDEPRDASPRDLARTLDSIDVAGATNLTAMLARLPELAARVPSSRLVLVTDGVNSMGDAQHLGAAIAALGAMHRPLTVVNASPRPDETTLRALAEVTGGVVVDLTTLSADQGVERAMLRPAHIDLGLPGLTDVAPRVVTTLGDTRVAVAGHTANHPFSVRVAGHDIAALDVLDKPDLVVRAWARQRLRELASPDEIAELGRKYTMLTQRTSLLVLESWRDYEEWGIEMPPDVAAQKARDVEEVRHIVTMDEALARRPVPDYRGRAAWWMKGRVIAQDGSLLPGVTVTLRIAADVIDAQVTDTEGRFWLKADRAPSHFEVRAELEGYGTVIRKFDAAPSGAEIELVINASVSETITVTASAPLLEVSAAAAMSTGDSVTRSMVQEPTAGIANEIERRPLERRHAMVQQLVDRIAAQRSVPARMREYAAARATAGGQKQLHLLVAEGLRADDADMALRVLTDLAEADQNDAAVARIVARIAEGWGREDVARELLVRALEVAPDEPQSWRELIVLDKRHGRAAEAKTLTERYAAASKSRHLGLPPDALEPLLHENADLEIDALWDCDFCDVDLHVVEPSGEHVWYSHTESKAGGRLSPDITTGFGPEIYAIARAPRGQYRIFVAYYRNDTTEVSAETLVHVIVTTRGRFGTRRSDHTLLLSTAKEEIDVTKVTLE